MIRPRKIVIIFALLVVLVGVYLFAAELLANRFTLVNESDRAIAWVEVEVCRQTTPFEDLSPGETASAKFQAKFDDSFQVKGKFADGTAIDGGGGYVTNGLFRELVRIRVSPDGQPTVDSVH